MSSDPYRPYDPREERRQQDPYPPRYGHQGGGGIPDGLLIAGLVLLLGCTALTWTAAGLGGLLAHGAWPSGVTFTRTPGALRSLITDPQDLPSAWPAARASALCGYGLFWGLLVGQLLVLLVLTVFGVGTYARAKAARRRRTSAREKQ